MVRTASDSIVGYVLITNEGDTIVLDKMAVDPAYRRRGIGTLIVSWVRGLAGDQGARRILLHVRMSNDDAIEFYRSVGFKVIERIENYYKKTGTCAEERAALEMQMLC